MLNCLEPSTKPRPFYNISNSKSKKVSWREKKQTLAFLGKPSQTREFSGAVKLARYLRLSWNAHVRSSTCQPNRNANTSDSMWATSEPNLKASIQKPTNQPHWSTQKAAGHGLKGLRLEEKAARVGFFLKYRSFTSHSHLIKTTAKTQRRIISPAKCNITCSSHAPTHYGVISIISG